MNGPTCAECGLPFGDGPLRAVAGAGVGVDGRLHERCYTRMYMRMYREGRRVSKTGRRVGVQQPKPAAAPTGHRHAPARCVPQRVKAPQRRPVLALEAVARIEGSPAEVCRKIVWATRGVFPRAGEG